LDDIDLTLQYEADISRFEAQYVPLSPVVERLQK